MSSVSGEVTFLNKYRETSLRFIPKLLFDATYDLLTCFVKPKLLHDFSEQLTRIQNNVEALPGETVTLITEHPGAELDVTWFKDNIPLFLTDGKCQTVNQDSSNQSLLPEITAADEGDYLVQAGGYESKITLTVPGW